MGLQNGQQRGEGKIASTALQGTLGETVQRIIWFWYHDDCRKQTQVQE